MTSSRSAPRPWRFFAVVAAALLVLVAVAGAFLWLGSRPDPDRAREALARSLASLKAGNATAANAAAVEAVRGDPKWGLAHAVLARTELALGDGVGAQGELQRAFDNGFDSKGAHQWTAEALLLQGQNDRALAEAAKTDTANRPYGLRIRGRALAALGDLAGARDAFQEAVRVTPNSAGAWTDIGRFWMNAGDVSGAIEAATKAVSLDPQDASALLLRAQLVRSQYGLIAALPWFESVLKRDPNNHDALIEYAATLGDAGRANQALAVTRQAQAARPGSAQAYYLQAVIAARAGHYDLARTLMDRTNGVLQGVPGALLLGATLDLEQGGFEQARDKLQNLVGMQPMNIEARKLLAAALLGTDSARNALDVLRPVVLRGDADSYALTLVGRAFERIGDRANAAHFFDRASYPAMLEPDAFGSDDTSAVLAGAAAEAPADPAAVVPYIRSLASSGDKAGALGRAQSLVQANPGAANAHLVLGDVLMLDDRYADAAAEYSRAADLRFDEPVLLRLVEAWERAGQRAQASNALALFLTQNPTNVAALRLSAHWQIAAGEFDSAIETLEGLQTRLGQRDAALQAELANAYAGSRDFDTAQDYAEAAYRLAPSNPAVADAWGWTLYKAGDARNAAELLAKAVSLAPKHAGLRWHLAQAYAALKRMPDARNEALAALSDPSFGERAAAQILLGQTG